MGSALQSSGRVQSCDVEAGPASVEILDVRISVFPRAEAIAHLVDRCVRRVPTLVAFANTNLLMQMRARGTAASLDDFLVLNDGIGLELAARALYGRGFPDNLVGTDFVPQLVEALPAGTRVFLLGAKPGVAAAAAIALQARTKAVICGTRDGYGVGPADIAAIAETKADVLLVAMGNPLQEEWMLAHARETGAVLTLGVGALFDNLAGVVKRAPLWMRKARCEWAFRLWQEPRRLVRRYTVDIVAFAREVRKQAKRAAL